MSRADVLSEPSPRRAGRQQAKQWSARALIRQYLSWLPGTILASSDRGVHWMRLGVVKGPCEMTVDCETIRGAQFALKKLRQLSPRELKRNTPYSHETLCRLDYLIDSLKQPARTMQLADFFGSRWQRRYRRLWRFNPSLRPLLRSVACMQLTCREPPDETMLGWIESNGDGLLKIRVPDGSDPQQVLKLQVLLCRVASDLDPTWLKFLMDFLGSGAGIRENLHRTIESTRKLTAQMAEVSRTQRPKDVSDVTAVPMAATLCEHISWLSQQPVRRRNAVSRLLSFFAGPQVLEELSNVVRKNQSRSMHLRREIKVCRSLGAVEYVIHRHKKKQADIQTLIQDDGGFNRIHEALGGLESTIKLAQRRCEVKEWSSDLAAFFDACPEFNW